MLAMPPRDGDFLMESGRHLVQRIGPAQITRSSENAHANRSVVSDPRQTLTATPAVTRHQFHVTAHFAERSDGHIADR
jgi:hypothetical protein